MHKYFRSSVWGGLSMLEMVLKDIQCWAAHMTLDINSGLDPEGKKALFNIKPYKISSYERQARPTQSITYSLGTGYGLN